MTPPSGTSVRLVGSPHPAVAGSPPVRASVLKSRTQPVPRLNQLGNPAVAHAHDQRGSVEILLRDEAGYLIGKGLDSRRRESQALDVVRKL